MPRMLADARTRVAVLTVEPADPRYPTVQELEAGIDASCNIAKSDYRLSPTASDSINDPALCSEGNAPTWGASNYEGTVSVYRFLDQDGATDPVGDTLYQALKVKGTTVWIVEREGPRYDVAWADDDEVEVYEVITDNPQKPTDRSGYIKRTIPLGVQRAWLDGVVGGGESSSSA